MNEARKQIHLQMNKGLLGRFFLPVVACLAFSGCVTSIPYDQITVWRAAPSRETFPAYHLRSQGNFGAGTFPGGNSGIIFDGLYYHHVAGGRITNSSSAEQLSSGWAVRFRADRMDSLPSGFDRPALEKRLARSVPEVAMACAFRIVGRFDRLAISASGGKSVPMGAVVGSLYGYRAADSDQAAATTELWFLSSDYRIGGRVDSFQVAEGSLAIDLCPRYLTIHPGLPAAVRELRR